MQCEPNGCVALGWGHNMQYGLAVSGVVIRPGEVQGGLNRSPWQYLPSGSPFRPTKPVQFSVYLKGQSTTEQAPHRSSRSLANLAVLKRFARQVGQNAIQLTRDISWKEVKRLLRGGADPDDSGVLNAPTYHVLPYTYPLPYHMLKSYEG
jgi:hypothetical protein